MAVVLLDEGVCINLIYTVQTGSNDYRGAPIFSPIPDRWRPIHGGALTGARCYPQIGPNYPH
jgi:hypothetical protein